MDIALLGPVLLIWVLPLPSLLYDVDLYAALTEPVICACYYFRFICVFLVLIFIWVMPMWIMCIVVFSFFIYESNKLKGFSSKLGSFPIRIFFFLLFCFLCRTERYFPHDRYTGDILRGIPIVLSYNQVVFDKVRRYPPKHYHW